ncbi:hypothetical protein [Brachyspira pilosicoli]|uniref:hypothetical protein n=1 Tax=Brachyspira pilosicoli TaxID=52584 RepID=UPI001CA599CD|nr:hypothetical protein [Brachyspira pilosicoli]MBW5381736.1 hypothetical protein [Brachyspira pilosicoli]
MGSPNFKTIKYILEKLYNTEKIFSSEIKNENIIATLNFLKSQNLIYCDMVEMVKGTKVTAIYILKKGLNILDKINSGEINNMSELIIALGDPYDEVVRQKEEINKIYNKVVEEHVMFDNVNLYDSFDNKVQDLNKQLCGEFGFFKNIFKNKLGFTNKFAIMIIVDIAFIILLICLNLFYLSSKCLPLIENIKIGLCSLFLSGILFWVTKYYNRRIHETVQLIEDYQHKTLVLKSFNSYSKEIERFSRNNPEFLLDYLRKVSSTINRSPALDLNKRKADNSPVEDVKDILLQLGSLSKLKN